MDNEQKGFRQKLDDFLHEKNFMTDGLAYLEQKTGLNRLYLFSGVVAFLALYICIGYGGDFVVALLGFCYPAYTSVKAIESKRKDDDTQWLTYWVVYGTFYIAEFFSDLLFSWFPLYFLFKCIFLIWCMAPFPWNGSEMIYHRLIKPFVLKHQERVDSYLDIAEDEVKDLLGEVKESAKGALIDHITSSDNEKEHEEDHEFIDKKDD